MGNTCTICKHPERDLIDAAIVAGESMRNIAQRFNVGYTSVSRHAQGDIPQALQQSQAAKEEAQALDIISQLREINAITLAILKEARQDKRKQELALKAVDRIQKQLELQAKLLGAIEAPQVNVYMAPEWQIIRNTIVQTLQPYKDARLAVAAALQRLEGKDNARFN